MDKWTNGLAALDARQTRERLTRLLDECKFVSVGLELYQGQGLRDQAAQTERAILRTVKGEIERLAGMLAEYKSGPPVEEPVQAPEPEPTPAPPVTPNVTPPYDAFAAARARAEAKAAGEAEPTTAPAVPPRPQLPVRGARLPKLLPGRPA